ncbi:MAG TPA: CoA-binding protein [Candidatus Bathyarchaeia archaeon]|nr:CoA-binding protein [Candidatus Bathyarchaeia archaeon]
MHTNVKQDSHSDSDLKTIFLLKNIAVVGMSKNEEKAGHFVPKYLIEQGYNVIPVNPTITTQVLGRKSYPSIADIPEDIDIVDIFRKSEDIPAVIDDVINRKNNDIKVIWMQEGIYNEEAEKRAKANGMDVVFNRCMMAEHRRLLLV